MACTFMVWWFTTNLPVRLTKMCRRLGCLPLTEDWPDEITYRFWYRQLWTTWLLNHPRVPALLREGLVCPGCMSLHLSWVAAALLTVAILPVGLTPMNAVISVIGVVAWPYYAVYALNQVRGQNPPKQS